MNSLNLHPNKLEQIKSYWYDGKLSEGEARKQIFYYYNCMRIGMRDNYGRKK